MRRLLIALALLALAAPARAAVNTPTIANNTTTLTNAIWNPPLYWSHCTETPATTDVCDAFEAQVATDSGFTDIVWSSFTDIGDAFSVDVMEDYGTFQGSLTGQTALAPGTSYFVRVRQHTRAGATWSSFSANKTLTTRAAYGTAIYVRTDGNSTNCSGLVDAADPGSGALPRPCAVADWDTAHSKVSAGGAMDFGPGTFTANISQASKNRIEVRGDGPGVTILARGGTLPTTRSAWGMTITGDDWYIHGLTFRGTDVNPAPSPGSQYITISTSNNLVVSNVVFDGNVCLAADDTVTTDGVIWEDMTCNMDREFISGTQTTQFAGMNFFAMRKGPLGIGVELSGARNIQSSSGALGDHYRFVKVKAHNASNHCMETRGVHWLDMIEVQYWRQGNTQKDGVPRGTCDTGGGDVPPYKVTKYINILNSGGDDKMGVYTDNCTIGQAASYYDVEYLHIENSFVDGSSVTLPSEALSITSGRTSSSTAVPTHDINSGPGSVVTSTTQAWLDYNLWWRPSSGTLIQWDECEWSLAGINGNPSTIEDACVVGAQGQTSCGVQVSRTCSHTGGWTSTDFVTGRTPDAHSLFVNPRTFSTQNGNLAPRSNSPMIDAGNPAHRVRAGGGSRIDIGPIEFTSGPSLPSLSIGDVTVNEAAGTATVTVTQSVVDNTNNTTFQWRTADSTATAGADYTASAGTEFVVGSTSEAHSLSRSHSRKLAYDSVGARWYLFWLTGGGTGTASYAYSTDGIHWTVGPPIADGLGIGSTSLNGQFVAGVLYLVRRGSSAGGTMQDMLVVEKYSVGGSGALTFVERGILHYCGAGSTPTVSTCATATGNFDPIYYGDLLVDDQGHVWVAGHRDDQSASKHIEIIRSTTAGSIARFGTGAGCDATTLGACNTFWVTPAVGSITWGQGESGTTLFDLDGGAGVGITANDRGSASAPSTGQIVWSKNATGSATGWGSWSQLTNNLNQYPNSAAGGPDSSRLDDRRDSCVLDPATSLLHCAFIYKDTAGTDNANLKYFTYNHSTSTKSAESTLVGPSQETDGLQLAIDSRGSPSKVDLIWINKNAGNGYTMKFMQGTSCTSGCTWPAASTALDVSNATGQHQYPQWPEAVLTDTLVAATQDLSGGGNWNIVARSFTTTQGTGASGTIIAGQTSTTITVPILQDATSEAVEAFNVNLLNASTNVTILDAAGLVSIVDDDTAPLPTVTFDLSAQSVAETGSAVTAGLTLSAISASTVTVPYTVSGSSTATVGGSCTGSADYTISPASPITIAAGSLTPASQLTVTPCHPSAVTESTETVILVMGSPTNATAGAITTHTVSILDSDAVASVFDVSDVTVSEAAGTATVTITLTPALSSGTATVTITTAPGTATAPDDYGTATSSPTWTAGQTSKTLVVSIADDATFELTEIFTAVLSAPSGATIGIGTATITIIDDDIPVTSTGSIESGVVLAGECIDCGSPAAPPFTPRALGVVTGLSGVTACSTPKTGYVCQVGAVCSLPGTAAATTVPCIGFEIRYANCTAGAASCTGTIVTCGGGPSRSFSSDASGTNWFTELETLRGTGTGNNKRIIELRWGGVCTGGTNAGTACLLSSACAGGGTCDNTDGWFMTTSGQKDGMVALGGRYATLIEALIDGGYILGALGVTGSSSGGEQIAQWMKHYGGDPDAAVFFSSPFGGDVQAGCYTATATADCQDPVGSCATNTKGFPTTGSGLLDRASGQLSDNTGACCGALSSGGACTTNTDAAYTPLFQSESTTAATGVNAWDNTAIAQALGDGDDVTGAPYGARLWKEFVLTQGHSAGLFTEIECAGAPHDTASDATCAAAVRAWLQTNLVVRP